MTKPDTDARSDASWWEARYLSGDTPWDTGVVPPEVITLVESSGVSRGWALDLGCGSGVTSCYLATHGYRVVGIDLAREALRRGVARAATSALPCFFVRASAARLNFVHIRAALAIDIGCFHNLTPFERKSYIQSLAEHLQGRRPLSAVHILFIGAGSAGLRSIRGVRGRPLRHCRFCPAVRVA